MEVIVGSSGELGVADISSRRRFTSDEDRAGVCGAGGAKWGVASSEMGIEGGSAELTEGVFVVVVGPSAFVDLMTREVSGGAERLIDGSVVNGGRFF